MIGEQRRHQHRSHGVVLAGPIIPLGVGADAWIKFSLTMPGQPVVIFQHHLDAIGDLDGITSGDDC